jgi:alkylation response protein AidB-like acyl-CoA dehydrogenase
MVAPVVLAYGTEEQKQRWLPGIRNGDDYWCQGYSEPGSGSDLASLQCKAVRDGDHYIVNGTKIWTTHAHWANRIFCLVRTSSTGKPQQGISFLLFDMESPGVTTRPILLISGKSPFCETFFDDVKVPRRNLVGEVNGGWTIAKYLLSHEREMIGATGNATDPRSMGRIAVDALGLDQQGRLLEPDLRSQIARFDTDEAAFGAWMERVAALARRGEANPAVASALKFYGSELNKRRWELIMATMGIEALEWEGARSNDGYLARGWLRTKGNSIEGGTSEVMLNVVAKRILGMPGA